MLIKYISKYEIWKENFKKNQFQSGLQTIEYHNFQAFEINFVSKILKGKQ